MLRGGGHDKQWWTRTTVMFDDGQWVTILGCRRLSVLDESIGDVGEKHIGVACGI